MNIKLEHITKFYDKKVLDDINLEIKDVHAVGIIGESGCGKSTLLRLLAGMEYPESGKISVNEKSIIPENIREFQSEIGYVFQKHNLFPHLTVKENIVLILHKIKKVKKDEAEKLAEDMLLKLHLEDEMHKKPGNISGGQAQRASIARALATNPQIVFLDEPTAALDPILTSEVLKSIQELKQIGKDFIFVTHEIDFLRKFSDYIIFMNKGKIIEYGKADCLNNCKTKELENFIKGEAQT